MNPVLKLLSKRNQPNASQLNNKNFNPNILNLISGIKSGKIDPKQKVLSFLDQMTPQQKKAVEQLIPQLSNLGTSMGVSKQNLDSFISEVKNHLR